MGTRGPHATPAPLRAVPSKTKAASATKGTVRMPAGMSPAAKEIWKRKAPELVAVGLLKPRYVDAFEDYCEALAFSKAAKAKLVAEGTTITGDRGTVKNPAWQIWRDSVSTVLALGARFGMTPSDDQVGPAAEGAADGKKADGTRRFFTA